MRRRIAASLVTLLAAGTFAVLSNAQPASAIEVCAGQGTATTDPTFYPPFTGTLTPGNAQKNFEFLFTPGVSACVHVPSGSMNKTITANGTFSGWCGLSSGLGMTTNGALFAWIGVGSMLILTGHLVGVVNAIPDLPGGQSCAPTGSGALNFIVTGAATLLNCSSLPSTTHTLLPNDTFHVWVNQPCTPTPQDLINL